MEIVVPPGIRKHQLETVKEAVPKGYWGMFHEMGTGKSCTLVTIVRNLFTQHRKPLKTIIFCPQVVIDNWENEFNLWSKCGQFVEKLKGPKKKRIESLTNPSPGKHIFVTNYEALDMDGLFWEKKGEGRVVIDHGFEIFVADESHRLKNHSAKRTKMAIRMADKIKYRFLLTGTPMLKNPFDIWSQFRILDLGKEFSTNFFNYRNKYFYDKNAGMPGDKHFPDFRWRPGAEKHVREKIYSCANRILKEECLDLPPLTMHRIKTTLSSAQSKAYREMSKEFITYVTKLETGQIKPAMAQIALTKALRLLQIMSGFVITDDEDLIEFKDVPRLNDLQDILSDVDGKVIVWSVFKQNYEMIAKRCDKLKMSYEFLVGGQTPTKREEALENFTKKDSQVLIASPAAGGTGVNLVEAATSVWYSRNFSLEHRLQALARNHRGGSEIHKNILNIDLVAGDTIDEHVLETLDQKEASAESLLSTVVKLKEKLK